MKLKLFLLWCITQPIACMQNGITKPMAMPAARLINGHNRETSVKILFSDKQSLTYDSLTDILYEEDRKTQTFTAYDGTTNHPLWSCTSNSLIHPWQETYRVTDSNVLERQKDQIILRDKETEKILKFLRCKNVNFLDQNEDGNIFMVLKLYKENKYQEKISHITLQLKRTTLAVLDNNFESPCTYQVCGQHLLRCGNNWMEVYSAEGLLGKLSNISDYAATGNYIIYKTIGETPFLFCCALNTLQNIWVKQILLPGKLKLLIDRSQDQFYALCGNDMYVFDLQTCNQKWAKKWDQSSVLSDQTLFSPDGKWLYRLTNHIDRYNTQTGEMKEYALPNTAAKFQLIGCRQDNTLLLRQIAQDTDLEKPDSDAILNSLARDEDIKFAQELGLLKSSYH